MEQHFYIKWMRKEERIMRIAFLTLGCKVNSYETDKMKNKFMEAGDYIVSFEEEADIYLVNTCTVTNIADRKSRQMLHRAKKKNPQALIVATGCYVDSALAKDEQDESVDLFVPNDQKNAIVTLVKQAWQQNVADTAQSENGVSIEEKVWQISGEETGRVGGGESLMAQEEEHTRAYLTVQNGCNLYCSYCIIPYVRGPLTSKPIPQVVQELQQMAAKGIREVVLTGIHLSSYGVDDRKAGSFLELKGRPLLELLTAANAVEGIERIRLGSLEPRIITEEFVAHLAALPKVCPHFHLSLQSGCDETLRRMNRHYTSEQYLEGVHILRRYYENPAITTDIIVGFPGETEEEFAETLAFAETAAFAQIHVFKYSRRKGTVADKMPEQLSEQEKAGRSDRLLAVTEQLSETYRRQFIGQVTQVLLEEMTEIDGENYVIGYTSRYVRVAVPIGADGTFEKGAVVFVKLEKQGPHDVLLGHFAE
mgnify:FL=1